jgi:uncharacterized membrane protein
VLWIHVLAGVSWVGACGSFVLAATALAGSGAERRYFAVRSVPRLNRLCLGCASLIPLTGLVNLAFAARAHGNSLSREFTSIVAVKLALFAMMVWALTLIIGRSGALRVERMSAYGEADPAVSGLLRLYGFTMALGATALLLGLWLAGI